MGYYDLLFITLPLLVLSMLASVPTHSPPEGPGIANQVGLRRNGHFEYGDLISTVFAADVLKEKLHRDSEGPSSAK